MAAIESLMWLQDWYFGQCDGDWEHEFGIEIGTLDNPGWRIEIDLAGTVLDGIAYSSTKVERSENDWIFCEVVEHTFKAACGPRNLAEAIGVFRAWASEQGFEQRKVRRLGG